MEETPSTSDPTAIVQQMQTLTDIEGDLADTALAVVAQEPEPSGSVADATIPVNPDVTTVQDGTDADTLLQSAEEMENVLEQSIPAVPEDEQVDSSTTTVQDDTMESVEPAVNGTVQVSNGNDPLETVTNQTTEPASEHVEPSPVVQEALDAIHAVEVDLNNSIAQVESATVETPGVEQEPTVETSVTMEPIETSTTTIEPIETSTATVEPIETSIATVEPIESSAPTVEPIKPSATNGTAELPQPGPFIQTPTPVESIDIDLPEGLTPSSPSVLSNRDLIRAWKDAPTNPTILLTLFNWAVQKTEINDARAWYDALAKEEPTAMQPLLALINLELALSNFSHVEKLFGRALQGPSGGVTAASDVSLWKAYLHYIRRQNPVSEGAANVETVKNTVTQAYEFALKECGTDRESGEIWQEYIAFLSDQKPKNTWETQQQMDSLRKVYQRAVCIPLNNVEALWKAYDAFESGLNKLTAKKFLAEKSPAYMTARTALREIRSLTDTLPRPILPIRSTFSDQDRATVNSWKTYLKWEEGNPLVIEDQEVLHGRIGYALRRCLAEMRHFPELWHYAANHYMKLHKTEDAATILAAGVETCPKSFLLTFGLADIEEERGNFTKCHSVYDGLLSKLDPEIEALKLTVEKEVENVRGPEISLPTNDVDMTGEGASEVTKLIEEREVRGRLVAERRGRDVQDLAAAAGVVWVMYMRFARRAEGIKAARGVFGKARRSSHVTWHTFEASAMMEYHTNKDSALAIRIFELGFKHCSENVEYVVRYLQFLLSINDDTNARALFERSTVKIPGEKARPLWDAWARYEYMYGDLAAVQKLEARFAEGFPNDSPLKRFAQRFTHHGLDEIALWDLGFGVRQQPPIPTLHLGSTLPPPPPVPSPQKRSFPDSPRKPPGPLPRGSADRSHSPPNNKRYRTTVSPPRRFPERVVSRYTKDVSPMAPPPRQDRASLPAPPAHAPPPAQTPPLDRSGVTRSLAWFISSLPSSRSFDGPVFRPDDIMGLFGSISREGVGMRDGRYPRRY